MSLKNKRNAIIIALILRGILFYFTIMFVTFTILSADGPLNKWFTLALISVSLITLCINFISKSVFKRITFLSRQERKEFDTETV